LIIRRVTRNKGKTILKRSVPIIRRAIKIQKQRKTVLRRSCRMVRATINGTTPWSILMI
jgi:hypothetical protein